MGAAIEEPKMMPAQLAALLLTLLPVSGEEPLPSLSIHHESSEVQFHISGPKTQYLAGMLLSFNPELRHYFQGLPPLLGDHAVLSIGIASGTYVTSVGKNMVPPGIFIHAQGVIAYDTVIASTEVESFVLDGGPPRSNKQ